MQWRFHPHACPRAARVYPFGYAGVACQSWIRSEFYEEWLNSHSLTLDYVERGQSDWTSALGDSRSFADRLMGPPEVSGRLVLDALRCSKLCFCCYSPLSPNKYLVTPPTPCVFLVVLCPQGRGMLES